MLEIDIDGLEELFERLKGTVKRDVFRINEISLIGDTVRRLKQIRVKKRSREYCD